MHLCDLNIHKLDHEEIVFVYLIIVLILTNYNFGL